MIINYYKGRSHKVMNMGLVFSFFQSFQIYAKVDLKLNDKNVEVCFDEKIPKMSTDLEIDQGGGNGSRLRGYIR